MKKFKKIRLALMAGACLMISGCLGVLEVATLGSVLGTVASNAARTGESAASLHQALQEYEQSDHSEAKVMVVARLYCRFRTRYPEATDGLYDKLAEAGVPENIRASSRVVADSLCGDAATAVHNGDEGADARMPSP